jgi:Mediator complex subunit 15
VTPQQPPLFRTLSKEELSRLPPEQQKAYRDKQNQHQHQMFFAHTSRLSEEVRRTSPNLYPIIMDATSRARIVKILTAPVTKQMLTRFNVFLYHYYLMTRDSDAVKQLLSYKMHLLPQYSPVSVKAGTWEAAEQFSVSVDYVEAAVKDLQARFNHVMSRVGPQQPAANVLNVSSPSDATGSHPLSADNLKKHQDMQAAQRAKRPAQEAPPAPTASRPPFTFTEGSPRGHGTPRYAPAKQGLQQEDLKLPSKRQKKTHQDNSASTPVGGPVTPTTSPEAAKVKLAHERPFKCTVAGCEFQEQGFAAKNELDKHLATVHKPVEEHIADPLAFFLESLREGLGLDESGQLKTKLKLGTSMAPEPQKTLGKNAGLGSKPATPAPAPSAVAMARGLSQISGPNDASSNPLQLAVGKGRQTNDSPSVPVADIQGWNNGSVSISDLQNTFGNLVNTGPRVSLNHHDPLIVNNDMGEFVDQFMESEAWNKMQETAVKGDTPSSKATESPAQHSDQGPGSSDISKGDELFIKIGPEDTELAESWALPELRLSPEVGAGGEDETEQWMKMDPEDVSTEDVDVTMEMDFEWNEVDWDKMLAEQEAGKTAAGTRTGNGNRNPKGRGKDQR